MRNCYKILTGIKNHKNPSENQIDFKNKPFIKDRPLRIF